MYVEGEEEIMQLHVRVTVLGKSSTCIEKPKRQICSTKFVGFVLVCHSSPHNRQICSTIFFLVGRRGPEGAQDAAVIGSQDHHGFARSALLLWACGCRGKAEYLIARTLSTPRCDTSHVILALFKDMFGTQKFNCSHIEFFTEKI
jgi:hypothetical protein